MCTSVPDLEGGVRTRLYSQTVRVPGWFPLARQSSTRLEGKGRTTGRQSVQPQTRPTQKIQLLLFPVDRGGRALVESVVLLIFPIVRSSTYGETRLGRKRRLKVTGVRGEVS